MLDRSRGEWRRVEPRLIRLDVATAHQQRFLRAAQAEARLARARRRASIFCRVAVLTAFVLVATMALRTAFAFDLLTRPPAASVASPRAAHPSLNPAVEADRVPTGEAQ